MRARWPALAACAALAAAGALWASGLIGVGQAWLAMRAQAAEWADSGLWLPHYRVVTEGRPVEGVDDNLSGLTFSPATGTLFAVINRPPSVAEISVEGDLLRLIPIAGGTDPEGITSVDGSRFIIADEARNRLSWVEITPGTTSLDLTAAPHIAIDLEATANMGFEGISWDSNADRLIVVQEMWPARVLKITGLARALAGEGLEIEVEQWSPAAGRVFLAADLSSASLHEPTGNLILLSDVTAALIEYSPAGEVVSLMPLWRGWNGLTHGIPQAEGVAVGPNGDIFIVSEPNLLYRFRRDRAAAWAAVAGGG